MHSIHYLDWIISLLGQPKSVYCRSVKHPKFPRMKDSRSSIILDYENTRCCLSLNHTHDVQSHGMKHSHAYDRVEGARGAAFVKFGLLLDYPKGEPEEIEISTEGVSWTKVDNVKKCVEGTCNTFKNIGLSKNTIELGQDISVINLDTGSEIAAFQVKIIRYGRMVKMCWIGDTEGINEGTYLTVGGCKQK